MVETVLDPRELKRLVSARLLNLPGVTAVGVAGGTLTVYLSNSSSLVRNQVIDIVNSVAPDAPVSFQSTDPMRPIASHLPGRARRRA